MPELDDQPEQNAPADPSVNIIDRYGEAGNVPQSQLSQYLQTGAKVATPDQVQAYQTEQANTGYLPAAKAFGAGAARGGTFGLSDEFLVHGMGVDPETLANLKKYQPVASGAGEIAGIGAGILAAPEAEAVSAAKEAYVTAKAAGVPADILSAKMALNAARASPAARALTTSDIINPVSAFSKVGQGISAAFTPEATTLAGQIASKALGGAAGSAIEGAAYGLGQSVSEDALGDPNALGEKLLVNMGHSAILGGAIGGVLHGAMAPFVKDDLTSSLDAAQPKDADQTIIGSIESGQIPNADKTSYIQGLKELKPDAPEIKAAADDLGVNTYPGQISKSEHVQKVYGTAIQSPYIPGVNEATLINNDFKTVTKAVDDTLGETVDLSNKELGDQVKDGMIKKVSNDVQPLTNSYEALKPYREGSPLSPKAQSSVARNIINDESLITNAGKPLNADGPQYKLAQAVSEKLKSGDLVSVDDLSRYRTSLRQDFGKNPDVSHIYGVIQDKLKNLESKWLDETEAKMITPEAKLRFANFRSNLAETNAKYADFKDRLGSLGAGIGKKRVLGAQDMINFLEDTPGSKFGEKITRDNPEFIQFLKQEFPDQFNTIKQFQKSEIRKNSYGQIGTGVALDPKKVLKNINNLSKEAKAAFFSPDEIKKLGSADKWLSSWGAKVGPSGTPQGMQYLSYILSPKLAIAGHVGTSAALRFAKSMVGSGNAPAQVAGLARLERMAQETTSQIKDFAQAIFTHSNDLAGAYAGLKSDNHDSFEKKAKSIKEDANNPEAFMDKLENSTTLLHQIAPKTASALQSSAAQAVGFLNSKLPTNPEPRPLSGEMPTNQSDIDTFNRYYNAVQNPPGALKEIANGTLTQEHMEALQTVTPSVYNEMKQEVISNLMKNGEAAKKMPYHRKMALSLFLGQDLDDSLEQPLIAQNQMAMVLQQQADNQAQAAGAVKTTAKGLSQLTKAKQTQTPLQQTITRES